MSEQLLINVTAYETRVALVEHGSVAEIFIERHRDRGIVGNIYLGKVQRVLPGMQAAFVEIGLEKAAFLYVGDVVPPPEERPDRRAASAPDGLPSDEGPPAGEGPATPGEVAVDDVTRAEVAGGGGASEVDEADEPTLETQVTPAGTASGELPHVTSWEGGPSPIEDDGGDDTVELRAGVVTARPGENAKGARRRRKNRARSEQRIEQLLRPGQSVLVQVAKDAIGTKGPRVTCNISLPGRHLVFMPMHDHIGVSRRITDDGERHRLKQVLEKLRPPTGGFVVRTVSAGLSEDKLEADARYLLSLWEDVQKRAATTVAPALVQPEHDLMLRCARDLLTAEVGQFIVDEDESFERVKRFMELRDPTLLDRLQRYQGGETLFERYGVEAEIDRAMSRKVWLKSGGYLVIDQAEALTCIDVNTGRFVGKRNLEDTIVKTNLEAVKEVAAQLRFRNIGGMVIIDFIDMEVPEHRDRILDALEDALKKDRARCNVVRMSELGLVEMTRQRTRESLGRQLTETCWYCEGRAVLKSKRTVVYDIFRALERLVPRFTEPVVVVQAHPEVADVMLDEEAAVLADIQERSGHEIVVRPRGSFHQEQYDIFGTSAESMAKNTRRLPSRADA